ncbi:hypothetical protein MKFW12EY_22500 [Methylomonas koyamae]|nr:hypothetical protein MKFW12EY_22500 [Methylomonas koyamae]
MFQPRMPAKIELLQSHAPGNWLAGPRLARCWFYIVKMWFASLPYDDGELTFATAKRTATLRSALRLTDRNGA